jgi:predicted GIY-YIG superfamily endonuclease
MYYFYVIVSAFGRIGFGIATDPQERNKQYCSHSGGIVQFVLLYGGERAHAKALERIIKTQYVDNIWKVEDWKTEWLNDNVTIEEFQKYIEELILERHIKVKLITTNYDFRQDLL